MIHGRADYDFRIQDKAVPNKKTREAAEKAGTEIPSHIGSDEPVFLMRARDRGSMAGVQGYIKGLRGNDGDPAVIRSAQQQADAIQKWQEDNPEAVHRANL